VYGTFPDANYAKWFTGNHSFQEHEASPHTITNPYGMTKMMGETILRDLAASDPTWEISILRYFNPVGAHTSGLIGENPLDSSSPPNNLAPYVARVAAGLLQEVKVFGGDYPTVDGTVLRYNLTIGDTLCRYWYSRLHPRGRLGRRSLSRTRPPYIRG
jgi:UDP-glucose 4-epimerase